MQAAGYFVVLIFVGLGSAQLSMARVLTRIQQGGHAVNLDKVEQRFPRTQAAIAAALSVADVALLTDNSRTPAEAFTVCGIRLEGSVIYDLRSGPQQVSTELRAWLDRVAPL